MNDDWRKYATDNGYKIICIMKDLEDGEIYPIYFMNENDLQKHKDNIISESKIKIIETIKLFKEKMLTNNAQKLYDDPTFSKSKQLRNAYSINEDNAKALDMTLMELQAAADELIGESLATEFTISKIKKV